MSPTLEDQERHLLVKVIDRILYKLDDLVRPYVHKVSLSYLYASILKYGDKCIPFSFLMYLDVLADSCGD